MAYIDKFGVSFSNDRKTLVRCPEDLEGEYCIPDSVTSIGANAFSGCSSLTSVRIPDSVTSIGGSAFCGCSSLTSVNIPDRVTCIEDFAFFRCSSLTSVDIPDSVTSIGGSTFSGCSSLTSITIGKELIRMGADGSCCSLTSMMIGNELIRMGTFGSCSSLTAINVSPDNPKYCSIDGVLFNKDQSMLLRYPEGRQGAYTIPESVTSIEDGAFFGCSSLTSVNIPDRFVSIEIGMFQDCSSLTSITIGKGTIRMGGLWGCSGLTAINVSPDNPKYSSIDGVLFNKDKSMLLRYPEGRPGAYTIPDGVISVGEKAFYNCSGLSSLTIPDSVRSLGYKAFSGCTGLTFVSMPEYLVYIEKSTFESCPVKMEKRSRESQQVNDNPNGTAR